MTIFAINFQMNDTTIISILNEWKLCYINSHEFDPKGKKPILLIEEIDYDFLSYTSPTIRKIIIL